MKAHIIKVDSEKVYLSNEEDDGKFFTAERASLEFTPKVGDVVDAFLSESGETLILPIKKSSIVLAESAENISDSDGVSEKSRAAAAILCFFFGWLGIHNFYLGNVGQGLLTLALWILPLLSLALAIVNPIFVLFSATLCPIAIGVFTLVDFILILCGIKSDGNGDKVVNWG